MLTSKELVRRFFSHQDVARPPFIPWVYAFAARLEQVAIEEMLTSPGLLARALQNAQQLYGYDAIVSVLDPTLEAEVCGCSITWTEEGPSIQSHALAEGMAIEDIDFSGIEKRARLPVVLEATKRLTTVAGKSVAVAAAITGPLTLASHLTGTEDILAELRNNSAKANKALDIASKLIPKVTRLYCESGVDLIVVSDPLLPKAATAFFTKVAQMLQSVWNIARFYTASSIVLSGSHLDGDHYDDLLKLGADGLVVAPSAFPRLVDSAVEQRVCLGLGMSPELLSGPQLNIERAVGNYLQMGRRFFLTTEGEVQTNTPPESIHYIIRALRNGAGG
jgi:uroporphyrinogen-III decarboxylase